MSLDAKRQALRERIARAAVTARETLVILASMTMHYELRAPRGGRGHSPREAAGDKAGKNELLFAIR